MADLTGSFDLRLQRDDVCVLTLRPRRTLPAFQTFLDHWYATLERAPDAHRYPLKGAFTPDRLAPIAQSMILWEGVWDAEDRLVEAHIRYIGGQLEALIQYHAGGKMTELDRQYRKFDEDYRAALLTHRQPIEAIYPHLPFEGYEYIGNTRLALPLSRDGAHMDFVLVLHKLHTPEDPPCMP